MEYELNIEVSGAGDLTPIQLTENKSEAGKILAKIENKIKFIKGVNWTPQPYAAEQAKPFVGYEANTGVYNWIIKIKNGSNPLEVKESIKNVLANEGFL